MKNKSVLLKFPVKKSSRKKSINLDRVKYFNQSEIKMLRRYARNLHQLAMVKKTVQGVRNWMIVDLLTSTGLRVSEAANLKIKHLKIGHGQCEIFVENGKGSISGTVQVPLGLKKHLKSFLKWKTDRGEGIQPDDYLLIGQRGAMSCQALQQAVKKYLKALNLYEKGKSVHALRHSYAVKLYAKEKDIRAVQRQLRHVSIQSTLVYADVAKDEIQQQIKGLWN